MTDWKDRINQWSGDRNLTNGSKPQNQMVKLYEETTELLAALQKEDIAEIVDAIGDIQVVLGVICAQLNLDIDECREAAWEEIKDRRGKMVNGVFVNDA